MLWTVAQKHSSFKRCFVLVLFRSVRFFALFLFSYFNILRKKYKEITLWIKQVFCVTSVHIFITNMCLLIVTRLF